jgi:DNA-damage-inducible protein D
MTEVNPNKKYNKIFESTKHVNEHGVEFWLARELSKILNYSEYRHFLPVIGRAKEACKNSGHNPKNHFEDILDMVGIGSNASREVEDVRFSRYACYLIVQNADPTKEIVAYGQTYFAMQTRRQELQDQERFTQLSEDERRIMFRRELAEHNKALTSAAKEAGVETTIDYAIFQDHGYRGLYGGLGSKDIHAKKQLKKSQRILDYMGSTELAANLFRATQAEEKLKRDQVVGKDKANIVHFEVGQKVRRTISEIGGVMPENLPTPQKSISKLLKDATTPSKDLKFSDDKNVEIEDKH